MSIDLTSVIVDLIAVFAAILASFMLTRLAPAIKRMLESFKASYPAEAGLLEELITTGINGAEKQFGHGEGALKLEAALTYVEKQAERYGLHFDEYVVEMMIHAKLHELETAAKNSLQ